jgi:hypothetical protein
MASEVDIANLALAHLGDTATVSSIDPPDGSAQAEHCARFYPFARNSLLEMATWGFATKRVALALLTNTWNQWQFAYAVPAGLISTIAVLSSEATDDYSAPPAALVNCQTDLLGTLYTPQPFTVETIADGSQIILTNVENAILRYTYTVEDTTQFSPLFTLALSWLLASFLAGPLIKGETGAAEAKRCLAAFQAFKAEAVMSDANDRSITPQQATPWIVRR